MKKTIEVTITADDHQKFEAICKKEGKTLFEKMDELIQSFLAKGETHLHKAS